MKRRYHGVSPVHGAVQDHALDEPGIKAISCKAVVTSDGRSDPLHVAYPARWQFQDVQTRQFVSRRALYA